MSDKTKSWHTNLRAALLRHGYAIPSEETLNELHARTSLPIESLRQLLRGDEGSTINALLGVCGILNLPPAEVLNAGPNLLRIYAIDGSSPITVVLPPSVSVSLRDQVLEGAALMYAGDVDDSFPPIGPGHTLICIRGSRKINLGKLYLLESDVERFVRRCIAVNPEQHEVVLGRDAGDPNPLVIATGKVQLVNARSPLVVGEVVWSFATIEHAISAETRSSNRQMS